MNNDDKISSLAKELYKNRHDEEKQKEILLDKSLGLSLEDKKRALFEYDELCNNQDDRAVVPNSSTPEEIDDYTQAQTSYRTEKPKKEHIGGYSFSTPDVNWGTLPEKAISISVSAISWTLKNTFNAVSAVLSYVAPRISPFAKQGKEVASSAASKLFLSQDENGKAAKKLGLPKLNKVGKIFAVGVFAYFAHQPLWYMATNDDVVIYTGSSDTKHEVEPDTKYRFSGCILKDVKSLDVKDPENLAKLQDAIDNAEDHKKGCNSKTQREFEINKSWLFPILIDPEDEQYKSVQGTAVCSMKKYSWSIRIPIINRYVSRTQVYGIVTCKQPSAIMTKSLSEQGAIISNTYNNVASLEPNEAQKVPVKTVVNGQTVKPVAFNNG